MIELSFAGLIGAFVGTAVAALAYGPLAALVERRLRAWASGEISLARRALLAIDILVFAGAGYWLGALVAG
jgi:hypothetical protein